MKVLHVNFSDHGGGAAAAAHRLLTAQRSIGLDSQMVVIRKYTADPAVHAPLGGAGQLKSRVARFFAKRIGRAGALEAPEVMRTLAWLNSGLGRAIKRENADIIHLHWLGSEMISLSEIADLPSPIVW